MTINDEYLNDAIEGRFLAYVSMQEMANELKEVRAKIKRYEEALKWYAYCIEEYNYVDHDQGKYAREALEQK